MWAASAVVVLAGSCILARPSGPDITDEHRESRAASGFKAEHRGPPLEGELLNMRYYGGAEGNVLVYHPTLGVTSVLKQQLPSGNDKDNVGEEDAQESGDGDGVTINLPPPGASVAEVRPVGLSIAGVGGVAASKPTGTAVVGPGGLAIARPIATAIAGVPPDLVLGSGSQGSDQQSMRVAKENYVAVGPHVQYGAKYGVVPITRNIPRNSPTYFRFQPQAVLNSVQYSPQSVLLYPVAYY